MKEKKVEAMEALQDIKDYIHGQVNNYLKKGEVLVDFVFFDTIDNQFSSLFDKIDNL